MGWRGVDAQLPGEAVNYPYKKGRVADLTVIEEVASGFAGQTFTWEKLRRMQLTDFLANTRGGVWLVRQ